MMIKMQVKDEVEIMIKVVIVGGVLPVVAVADDQMVNSKHGSCTKTKN